MKIVGITEAAKLTGKSRTTLWRDVASGRLSATSVAGVKRFDVAELSRVYGEIRSTCNVSGTVAMERDATTDETTRMAVLEAENRQLREVITAQSRHLDDLRAAIRLLENKVQKADTRPWLLRMFW